MKDWEYLRALGVDSQEAEALITPRHRELGLTFQHYLYGLVRDAPSEDAIRALSHEAPVVVETGVRTGVSTYFVLEALAARDKEDTLKGGGHLYSCDPMYSSQDVARVHFKNVEHFPYWKHKEALFDNWTFVGAKSHLALPQIAEQAPLWDVFVHDSAHDAATQRFELDFAWAHLREGGWIVVNNPRGVESAGWHCVFEEWAKEKGLPWATIGSAAILNKPVAGVLKLEMGSFQRGSPSAFYPFPLPKPLKGALGEDVEEFLPAFGDTPVPTDELIQADTKPSVLKQVAQAQDLEEEEADDLAPDEDDGFDDDELDALEKETLDEEDSKTLLASLENHASPEEMKERSRLAAEAVARLMIPTLTPSPTMASVAVRKLPKAKKP